LASWHRRWHSSCAIELFRKTSKVIRNRGGYWQVKVYAGLDPLTGKQRFEYDRAKTKREGCPAPPGL
jgi:hypothetical protein